MTNLTYRQLLDILNKLPPDKLSDNVTVEHDGEFYAASAEFSNDNTDILDVDHLYITTRVYTN